ncbi:hypothetical protein, partial [Mesorhizobium sp. M0701]|uniref:hypothetical protein n=1 Tax=Mesorhizobium sp. M0701 TaxID=2956989 RepID=UPI00333D75F2
MPFERRGPSGLEPAVNGTVVDRHAFRSGQPRIVQDPVNGEPVKESLAQLRAFLLLFGTCSVGADPEPQQAGGSTMLLTRPEPRLISLPFRISTMRRSFAELAFQHQQGSAN